MNSPTRYSGAKNTSHDSIFREKKKKTNNKHLDLNQSIESAHFSSSDFTKYVDYRGGFAEVARKSLKVTFLDTKMTFESPDFCPKYVISGIPPETTLYNNNKQSEIRNQGRAEHRILNNYQHEQEHDAPKICDTPTRSSQYQVHVGTDQRSSYRRPFSTSSPSKKKHRAPETPESSIVRSNTGWFS